MTKVVALVEDTEDRVDMRGESLAVSVCDSCNLVHLSFFKDGILQVSFGLDDKTWTALFLAHAMAQKQIAARSEAPHAAH